MIKHALDKLFSQYIDLMAQNNSELGVEYDPQWLSPCIDACAGDSRAEAKEGDSVLWKPVLQNKPNAMENIGKGLDIAFPADLAELFTRYYSLDIPAKTSRGELALLQVWNENDFERLQHNLIGHVLMKRRLKQADTLFFAVTDDDDYVISYDLAQGSVVLEPIGREPSEVLAPNLSVFIDQLSLLPKVSTL